MRADEAFAQIFADDGHPNALRLQIERGNDLRIDLHSGGHITLWWKGEPIEFLPMFPRNDDRTNDSTDSTSA